MVYIMLYMKYFRVTFGESVLYKLLMPLEMKGQVVRSSECSLAVWALEGLDSSVLAHVTSQLV